MSNTPGPRFSLILLTKNAGELFPEVLSALFACEGMAGAEVIMIDSGSSDLTLEHAQGYRQIRLVTILPGQFGHGRTRNLVASLAGSDILVYLVQDATPARPDFLKRLLAPMANPEVAGVYARQLPRTSTNPVERFFLKATYPDLPQTRRYAGEGPIKMGAIFFSNVASAIRRTVWERFPFDENLIMSEDQQWAKEVLRAGYQIIYEPSAAVYHSHNYGLRQIFQRNFDSGSSLRGLVDDSLGQMLSYEARHIHNGLRQLSLWGHSSWTPYFLLQEAVRSMGFFLGQKSHLSTTALNRRLSMHKYYWDHGKTNRSCLVKGSNLPIPKVGK